MNAIQRYEPIRQWDEDLYCVDGEWYRSPFRRRMTVARLRDGSLVIHNAIQMGPRDYESLEKLGPVGMIIVPNIFHDSEAHIYADRYPKARVFVPRKIRAKCAKRMRVDGVLEEGWPIENELTCIPFRDTLVSESVFVHLASRTLIVTDLAMNVPLSDFKNPLERLILGKWNWVGDQFGPSRLTKYVAARNRMAVQDALLRLSACDFDRVIMNHGRIIEKGGKRRFLEGYNRVYGFELPLGT